MAKSEQAPEERELEVGDVRVLTDDYRFDLGENDVLKSGTNVKITWIGERMISFNVLAVEGLSPLPSDVTTFTTHIEDFLTSSVDRRQGAEATQQRLDGIAHGDPTRKTDPAIVAALGEYARDLTETMEG